MKEIKKLNIILKKVMHIVFVSTIVIEVGIQSFYLLLFPTSLLI